MRRGSGMKVSCLYLAKMSNNFLLYYYMDKPDPFIQPDLGRRWDGVNYIHASFSLRQTTPTSTATERLTDLHVVLQQMHMIAAVSRETECLQKFCSRQTGSPNNKCESKKCQLSLTAIWIKGSVSSTMKLSSVMYLPEALRCVSCTYQRLPGVWLS